MWEKASVKVTAHRTKTLPLCNKETRKTLLGENATDVESLLNESEGMRHGMSTGFCLPAQMLFSVRIGLGKSLKANTRGTW
jgi:hypothetical protein